MKSMLETNDLEAIEKILDKRMTRSENLMVDQMERTRRILEAQINQVRSNLEDLRQYYRIQKPEDNNTTLLLQMITELTKRVEELEKRSAG